MSSRLVRWGVLAPGNIARRFVADLKTVPGAEVVAVGSRDATRSSAFAREFGIARSYGSYLELVEDPAVNVVYVCSPHIFHYEHAMLALGHHKSVLIEKPFAISGAQATQMVELAKANGLFLMEALWTRFQPVSRELTRRVADGAIGDVRMINATLGPIGTFAGKRSLNYAIGGGALFETGVYPLSLAMQVLPEEGEPQEVQAWATIPGSGIDESTTMVLSYASGAVVSLGTSFVPDVPNVLPSRAFISGSGGWIDIPRRIHRPPEFTLYQSGAEPETVSMPDEGNGYTYEAAEVVRCVREGLTESPVIRWESTLTTMRILNRVRERIGLIYPGEQLRTAGDHD